MTTEAACRNCGRPITPDARFCQHCGIDVSQGALATGFASSAVIPKSIQDALLERLKAETLGDYEILTEVGRGGMATVYLAHDIALDRKVAIKVMSSAIVDEGMAERFRREARTAAALNHPHIIPIYAVRDRYPLLFFAMKFIAGQSLDPILKTAGGLPIPMVQTILSQAGSALGYAHRRGVIHRDVKPANVMIDDEGWVVVTDFGIAKVSSATGLTVTGVTVGTPAYMSPEQCLGKEVTGASDQYSLGVVAYEMLTGAPPFSADSAMAVMFAQFQETPKPILESRPDCPTKLADIVMRMLEKDPEKRWPTIDDAVAAIGASPLPHDDPTRKKLISMAVSSENAQLTRRISTPTSPAPAVRRSGRTIVPGEVTPDAPPPVAPGPLGETIQHPMMAQPAPADTPATPPRVAVQTPAVQLPSRAPAKPSRLPWIAAAAVLAGVVTFAVVRSNGDRGDSISPPVAPAESTVAETPTPAPPAAVNTPITDSAATAPAPKAVDRVTLALSRTSFQVGENLKLSVVAEAADGTPLADRKIEWSSSSPGIARVTENGTLRALRPGQATIIATVEGRSTTTRIEVVSPAAQPPAREAIAAMSVVPDAAPLTVGSTMTLSAVLRDGSGKRLEDRTIVWTSSSSAVSVFPNGQVLAVGPGTAVVTASSEGRSASATITVSPVPVASLNLTGAPSDLNVGDSVRLNVAAHDAKGGVLANRQTSWESSDPSVATVSGGLVIARSPGTATISAASEGKSASTKIKVTVPTPPVDPAAEKARAVDQVGKGIAAFVAALNSRDMGRLKQAYPGMSSSEESDWSKLLNEKSLSKFEAVLEDVQAPTIEATSAEEFFQVRMALTYAGLATETQRIRYQGVFRPDGGTWKLMRLIQR
ncbi:MAG TPA: protein kinase [Gemmatimonadales bacterium]